MLSPSVLLADAVFGVALRFFGAAFFFLILTAALADGWSVSLLSAVFSDGVSVLPLSDMLSDGVSVSLWSAMLSGDRWFSLPLSTAAFSASGWGVVFGGRPLWAFCSIVILVIFFLVYY